MARLSEERFFFGLTANLFIGMNKRSREAQVYLEWAITITSRKTHWIKRHSRGRGDSNHSMKLLALQNIREDNNHSMKLLVLQKIREDNSKLPENRRLLVRNDFLCAEHMINII